MTDDRTARCGTATTWEWHCTHDVDIEYLENLREEAHFLIEWADETTLQLVLNLLKAAPK